MKLAASFTKNFWILSGPVRRESCTSTSTIAAVSLASSSPAPGSGQRKTIWRLSFV